MDILTLVLASAACGVGLGYIGHAALEKHHEAQEEAARRDERRLLGHEPRPARRLTAVGKAKVTQANFKRNPPLS